MGINNFQGSLSRLISKLSVCMHTATWLQGWHLSSYNESFITPASIHQSCWDITPLRPAHIAAVVNKPSKVMRSLIICKIQWNLSVKTTSTTKCITFDLLSNEFWWRLKVPIYFCWQFLPSGAHLGGPWPPGWAPAGRGVSHSVVVIDRFHCICNR